MDTHCIEIVLRSQKIDLNVGYVIVVVVVVVVVHQESVLWLCMYKCGFSHYKCHTFFVRQIYVCYVDRDAPY